MPVPDIFTEGSPQEEKLAGYFEEMYDYLMQEGVPEDRLPGPWHMLSRMVRCIDPELLRDWLDAYVAVEGEGDLEEDEDDTEAEPQAKARQPRRQRPSYLRAIDDTVATEDEPLPDGEGPQTQTDGST